MRVLKAILTILCLGAPASLAQEQAVPPQSNITVGTYSRCVDRLQEIVPGFDVSLSSEDRQDLRRLLRPAMVLGRRGNEVACEAILSEVERIAEVARGIEGQTPQQRGRQIFEARSLGAADVLRVEDLLGSDVVTLQGEEVGEVEDFLVSTSSAFPLYALVSKEGWLALGDELVVVPLTSLGLSEGGDIVTRATAMQWEEAPEFEAAEIDNQAVAESDRYWKQ